MTTRQFTGTFENISSGVLIATLCDPAPADLDGMAIPGPTEFEIVDGAVEGELSVPGNYRFTIRTGGRDLWSFPKLSEDPLGVLEGDEPVSIQELALLADVDLDLGTMPLFPGSALVALSADGVTTGYVPKAQADGSIAWAQLTIADVQGLSAALGAKASQEAFDSLDEKVTSDHENRIVALEAAGPGGGGGPVDWGDVQDKPATFPPATHSHDPATTLAAGFLSAADKAKLDGIAPNATASAGDVVGPADSANDEVVAFSGTTGKAVKRAGKTISQLLDRGQHTGTQLAATIADFAIAVLAIIAAWWMSLDPDTYDLDNMPSAYMTWLDDNELTDSDGWRLQWCVDRLLKNDDGTPAERDIRILVGNRVYDVSDMDFQEEGTLGSYVFGTLYGACAQILIPATGPLADRQSLSLRFQAKVPSELSYSVVNGNPAHQLGTNAVIFSSATPPAGEGGNYAMIGASRALDGYANLRLTNVCVDYGGVTFRASGGLTNFDANYCFSISGSHFAGDVGVTADEIHLHDPRRNPDGTAYTGGAEIEYRKRQAILKTPLLWNGARQTVDLIEVMGGRIGVEWNEHLVVTNLFPNYCRTGVKLRGMSHISTLVHGSFQRCATWFEAPDAGDWNNEADIALLNVLHCGGEAYHDGEFGNPAGDRWYSPVSRLWDPNGKWKGDVTVYESPSEEPADGYETLPSGHGAQLYLRRQGEAPSAPVELEPDVVIVPLSGGTATLDCSDEKTRHNARTTLDANGTLTFSGLADGKVISWRVLVSGANRTLGFNGQSGWPIVWAGGSEPAAFTDLDDNRYFRVDGRAVEGANGNYLELEATDLGTVDGLTTEDPGSTMPTLTLGAPIVDWDPEAASYDASSGGNLIASGGTAIGRIEDAAAASPTFHIDQGTSGLRPTWETAVMNGRAIARFVKASSNRLRGRPASAITGAWTLFYVCELRSIGTSWEMLFGAAYGVNDVQIRKKPTASGGQIELVTPGGTLAMSGAAAAERMLITAVVNGASSKFRVNGVEVTGTLGDTDLGTTADTAIASWYDGSQYFSDLDLGRAVIYPGAATTQDITDWETWGNARYGV